MDMHPVESSAIKAIGYDADKQHMKVEFTSGSTFTYADVPEDSFHALKNAESVGKHFAANIRNQFKSP